MKTMTNFTFLMAIILAPINLFGTLTIVSDNFSSATFDSDTGVITSEMSYGPISNTTNTFFNVGSEGGNPGEFLNYGHTSVVTSFFNADLPSSISLSEIGDWAQISLDIRNTAWSGNRSLRFGLFESGDTNEESQGFFVAGGGNNSRLAADLATNSDQFLIDQPTVSSANDSGSDLTLDVWHSVFLRIEKTAADQFTLTSTFAGLNFDPFVVTSTSEFELDQVRFGITRNTTMHIDNLVVTAIPEPSTLVLLGIALGSVIVFRRRR